MACGSVKTTPDAHNGEDERLPPASGSVTWARSLSTMTPLGVFESAGGLTVTGYMSAPADLGAGFLVPTATDSAVAGYSPVDASYVYAKKFGGAGDEFAFLDNVDSVAVPIVHGVSYGAADLGLGPVSGGGGAGADGYVGRYTPTGPSWVKRIVGPGEDKLLGTALAGGSLYAVGFFEGTTSFDGTALTSAGMRDIVFAKLNPFTGVVESVLAFGSANRDEAASITAAGGGVVATGFFAGTLAFGAPLAPLVSNGAGLDLWVTKFTLAGTAQWAVRFGGTGEDRGEKIVADAAGDLYLTGTFTDQIAFGAVNLVSRGGTDVFLVKLRGADGSVAWATSFGSDKTDNSGSLALDAGGRVLVSATLAGPIEPGGAFAGGLDACVASYLASGQRAWVKVLGTTGDDRGWAVRGGSEGVYFGFSVAGALATLGVPITGPAAYTGLVLKIVP
jgi:hypothetical protein